MKIIKKHVDCNKEYFLINDSENEIYFEVLVVDNEIKSIGLENDIHLNVNELDPIFVESVKKIIKKN